MRNPSPKVTFKEDPSFVDVPSRRSETWDNTQDVVSSDDDDDRPASGKGGVIPMEVEPSRPDASSATQPASGRCTDYCSEACVVQ
eukprot:NODE_5363_length_588_cov_320.791745.p2 GENE.NODE_5363_length_588_cov_320.791745~~NODE_5363_length_588_cov_320.791745.p2  ORF type:complete len:85 (+),score=9.80 NODE_5363_length_588_cov_320.791745:195-449(+)